MEQTYRSDGLSAHNGVFCRGDGSGCVRIGHSRGLCISMSAYLVHTKELQATQLESSFCRSEAAGQVV